MSLTEKHLQIEWDGQLELTPEERREAMRVMNSNKKEDMQNLCSTNLFAIGDPDVDSTSNDE